MFLHALMNAKQLKENGNEVKIVLEGQSVALPKELEAKKSTILSFKRKWHYSWSMLCLFGTFRSARR